ncbi:hypothetical protein WDU94_015551 [Cyamophila willieti]
MNIADIQKDIGNSRIWISIDEATDSLGRYIANVIVGKLDGNKAQKGHLIHVAQLDKTNGDTIVQTVQEALRILWQGAPNTVDRFLLLVTDSVAYMLSAGKTLKKLYPKLIHETCFAHGLHRVAEAVRDEHPLVNQLISVGKKMFLKSPKRVEVFRNVLPDVPLPPEPVITRWGTWLSAASYYYKNFEGFKKVVEELEDDGASVRTAKSIIDDTKLLPQLLFLESNFSDLPGTIEKLQSQTLMLTEGVEMMQKINNKQYPGPIGLKIQTKVKAVLERNCGWKDVQNIAAALAGSEEAVVKENWTLQDMLSMKYAPVTSSDVERSFSKLKYILHDRRLRLTMDNLTAHLMLYYNYGNSYNYL